MIFSSPASGVSAAMPVADRPQTSHSTPHWGEWLLVICGLGALLLRCHHDSIVRPLWTDEALTAFAVADSSLDHMLVGLRDVMNAIPPLYFVLGWGFARVAGTSDLALRLPSTLLACFAMVILWRILRRYLNRWVATWCAVFLPLASPSFLLHACEARCYSLYFTAYVAAVGLFLRSAESQPMGSRVLWGCTLAHGALAAAHYVGGLLSGLLLVSAMAAGYLTRNRNHYRYAVRGLLGWLAVLPSVPFYLAQRRVGGDLNWVPRPGTLQLFKELTGDGARAPVVTGITPLVFAMALLVWALVADSGHRRTATRLPDRRPREVAGALAVLLVGSVSWLLLIWLQSLVAVNLFLNRYLFPLSVAWMLAIGFVADSLLSRLWGDPRPDPGDPRPGLTAQHALKGRPVVIGTAVVLSLLAGFNATKFRQPDPDQAAALDAMRKYPDVALVTGHSALQVELAWYRRPADNVFLVRDVNYRDNHLGAMMGEALERHYLHGSIKSVEECLRDLDALISVKWGTPKAGDIESVLGRHPSWEAVAISPGATMWRRRAETPKAN